MRLFAAMMYLISMFFLTSSGLWAEGPSLFQSMMSSQPDAHSIVYKVKSGDNLTKIAKTHGVTAELLQKINPQAAKRLLPGMDIKIPNFKMSVLIDKSDNTLTLKGDEEILKTYIVATGSNNSTPVGSFKITDKLVNPTWYTAGAVVAPDSPKNILGTRWMGLTAKGYGIHGTTQPETLGQQASAGCIRMKNEEVEELYSILPSGINVTVVD